MLKVTTITVHAGRTFNDPRESYSNFKPGLSLTATVSDGTQAPTDEALRGSVEKLQALAETLIEAQKARLLKDAEAEFNGDPNPGMTPDDGTIF